MKSAHTPLSVSNLSPGHITLEFDIYEWAFDRRITVAQMFGLNKFPDKNDYVVVGIIKETAEHMIVPPQFAWCTFSRSMPPCKRPPSDHVNHYELMEIINGSKS